MLEYVDRLRALLADNVPFVAVTIVHTIGSVPQDAGSKMLVTGEGLHYGTVGGGKVEKRAIEEAQKLLLGKVETEDNRAEGTTGDIELDRTEGRGVKVGSDKTRYVEWRLDKDVGMTCGGSVKLFFELFNTDVWNIVVFGAGHCSNALIEMLSKLDCRITCYDSRREWLDRLTNSPRVRAECVENLPEVVPDIPKNSFVLLMTMGHTTDKPILIEILRRWEKRSFPYLGVIGSKAKAARLKKDIQEAGLSAEKEDLFTCPMGLSIGNNHPQEIAISIIGQLLEVRDRHTPD
ncbi:MAG: XdhC family protein [Cyanobacteria bacterium]|nr:XdhC family protein [Cyanobacteriota bacterium]